MQMQLHWTAQLLTNTWKYRGKYIEIQGQIHGNTGTNTFKYRDKYMEIHGQIYGSTLTNFRPRELVAL